jgi:hypothetical protein
VTSLSLGSERSKRVSFILVTMTFVLLFPSLVGSVDIKWRLRYGSPFEFVTSSEKLFDLRQNWRRSVRQPQYRTPGVASMFCYCVCAKDKGKYAVMSIVAGQFGHMGGREQWKNEMLDRFSQFAKRPGCEGCLKSTSIETYP